MIGMITASVVRTGDAMEPSENSSMISRARARSRAREAGLDFDAITRLIERCGRIARVFESVPNFAQHHDELAKINVICIHHRLSHGIGQYV